MGMIPHSKEDSPLVGGNDIYGRGWDIAWESWAGGEEKKEKWNTGMRASIDAQFALSWTAPLWTEFREGYDKTYRMINFEPTLDLDLGLYMKVAFHLYFIEFEFEVNLMPYIFRPFDFTFQIDPFNPKRYCFAFDYFTKGLALEVFFEQSVKECTYGAVGIAIDDWHDCVWHNYNPEIPIFEIQATKLADINGEYFHPRCVNFYSAEWDDDLYPLPGYVVEEVKLSDFVDDDDDQLPIHF